MTHIVAYSGGLSSFEVARRVLAEHPPADVRLVFTDTNTEDEDLYRFLADSINYLDAWESFVHIDNGGKTIWDIFREQRFMGNSRIDPCSRFLKRVPFRQWIRDEGYTRLTATLYYGIGPHEAHRLTRLIDRWSPFVVKAPLVDLAYTKEQLNDYLTSVAESCGLQIPRLYDLGFEHNNCGGFCVKTGQRQMRHLLETMPERYAYHEAQQENLFSIIEPHGFIRQSQHGTVTYLTLKQFRERVEQGAPVQPYQDGSCACFI